MFLTTLLFMIASISFTLPLATTPLTLGIWVLFLALMIAITMCLPLSSWFGFILFIIYIGGLLVMFAYFAAIDPNSKMNPMNMFLMFLFTTTVLFSLNYLFSLTPSMNFQSSTTLSFLMLFTSNNIPMLLLAAMLLFLALVSVVKITQRKEGALRPFIMYV
nr:NADH dehydrogenase subunit 6 [Abarenicola claparedi oceanica]